MKNIAMLFVGLVLLSGCGSKRGFVIKAEVSSPEKAAIPGRMEIEVYEKYYTSEGLSIGFPRAFNLLYDKVIKTSEKAN